MRIFKSDFKHLYYFPNPEVERVTAEVIYLSIHGTNDCKITWREVLERCPTAGKDMEPVCRREKTRASHGLHHSTAG